MKCKGLFNQYSKDIMDNRRLVYNLILLLVGKGVITSDEAKEIERFIFENEEEA